MRKYLATAIGSALLGALLTYATMSMTPQAVAINRQLGEHKAKVDDAVYLTEKYGDPKPLERLSVVSVMVPVPSSWVPREHRELVLSSQTEVFRRAAEMPAKLAAMSRAQKEFLQRAK